MLKSSGRVELLGLTTFHERIAEHSCATVSAVQKISSIGAGTSNSHHVRGIEIQLQHTAIRRVQLHSTTLEFDELICGGIL